MSARLTIPRRADLLTSGIQEKKNFGRQILSRLPTFNIWCTGCNFIATTGTNEHIFSTKRHVQIPVACAILTNETLARQIVQHPAQTQEPRSLHAISMGAGPEKCMVARLKISRKSLTELVNQLSSWYVFNRLFQKCHIKYTIK